MSFSGVHRSCSDCCVSRHREAWAGAILMPSDCRSGLARSLLRFSWLQMGTTARSFRVRLRAGALAGAKRRRQTGAQRKLCACSQQLGGVRASRPLLALTPHHKFDSLIAFVKLHWTTAPTSAMKFAHLARRPNPRSRQLKVCQRRLVHGVRAKLRLDHCLRRVLLDRLWHRARMPGQRPNTAHRSPNDAPETR